jgi:CRISPR/Cas system-associated exonuclease Cas4 (RecB family)
MISLTFNKDKITDIPLILPVEMFIVEEKTAAPEFKQEVNEVIPDMVEQVQETEEEVIEEVEQIVAKEEILATESVEEENDFVIEKKNKARRDHRGKAS